MSETLFELERASDGDDLAALFGEFATAFEERRPASVEGDGTRLEIDPPPRATVELEVEREDEEDESDGDEEDETDELEESNDDRGDDLPPTIELEIELEWDEAAEGPGSVRIDESAGESAGRAADESRTTLSEPVDGDDGEGADELEVGDAGDPEAGRDRDPRIDAEDESGSGGGRRSRFEVYRDRADEWRWRLVHWNGNVVADGGEGYASRRNAERAARGVMRSAPDARIERLD